MEFTQRINLSKYQSLCNSNCSLTSQEAHYAEGEDGGVLGYAVDAQVDGSQDHSQQQGDQADGDHSLHSLEPVWKNNKGCRLVKCTYIIHSILFHNIIF